MLTRLLTIGHMALIIFHLQFSACHPLTSGPRYEARGVTTSHRYPTRELAGITVIDTSLVRSAQAFALAHSSSTTYNHVMRSWLFGALMVRTTQLYNERLILRSKPCQPCCTILAGTKPHRPLSYPPTDASK
ncbi:hypothetical protein QC762_700230 [Podospora pseudocomata]|uniref:Secreted protein n=1 Tax=Podospora pseudocomata TaxID=2093779 RepID=A0ABR0G5P3_9PEZI|nr:hypothetical protein QC762_700230 [Podospora pseudocomata]